MKMKLYTEEKYMPNGNSFSERDILVLKSVSMNEDIPAEVILQSGVEADEQEKSRILDSIEDLDQATFTVPSIESWYSRYADISKKVGAKQELLFGSFASTYLDCGMWTEEIAIRNFANFAKEMQDFAGEENVETILEMLAERCLLGTAYAMAAFQIGGSDCLSRFFPTDEQVFQMMKWCMDKFVEQGKTNNLEPWVDAINALASQPRQWLKAKVEWQPVR